MKRNKLNFLTFLLPIVVLIAITSCGKDNVVDPSSGDSNNNGDNSNQQEQEIVVTVDDNGKASEGHSFTRLDETNFYIDNLKYSAIDGNLTVSGYDPVLFTGAAKIISKLVYNGRTMNVVSIKNEAFKNCTIMTFAIISKGVAVIGEFAFSGCTGLTNIYIPGSVTSIGRYVFSGCTGLTKIYIPGSVTSIGSYAFLNCSGLKKVIVPDIAAWCSFSFDDTSMNPLCYAHHLYSDENTEITNLVIPNGVTKIGRRTFYGCSSFKKITISSSVIDIGYMAFCQCSSLSTITFPDNVTSIGGATFFECKNLTSVTIGSGMTNIGFGDFSGCPNLISIKVKEGNADYDSKNGCNAIIETETNTLIAGCKNTIIPNSVTSIGHYAFYICGGLTSIIIPKSVTSIGYDAFYGCSDLTDIYCYAEEPPTPSYSGYYPVLIYYDISEKVVPTYDDYREHATLHVPVTSVESYQALKPWSGFSTIVGL